MQINIQVTGIKERHIKGSTFMFPKDSECLRYLHHDISFSLIQLLECRELSVNF